MNTIKHLQPSTTHEAGTHLRLNFRRDFGSFQQQRAQPQRLPEATRAYQQGDPLAAIDWRAYARTDQLLINQQRHTANAEVLIAVSCVPAMHWPPAAIHVDATTKLETALRIALNLAFIHSKILDRVTLCLAADQLYMRKISSAAEVLDIYENFYAVKFNFAQLLRVCTFTQDKTSLEQLTADAKYWLSDGLQGNFRLFCKMQCWVVFCTRCHLMSARVTGWSMTAVILSSRRRCWVRVCGVSFILVSSSG